MSTMNGPSVFLFLSLSSYVPALLPHCFLSQPSSESLASYLTTVIRQNGKELHINCVLAALMFSVYHCNLASCSQLNNALCILHYAVFISFYLKSDVMYNIHIN